MLFRLAKDIKEAFKQIWPAFPMIYTMYIGISFLYDIAKTNGRQFE